MKQNWICLLDVYRTYIRGPVIYYFDPETDEELYGNYKNLGSQGVEVESRLKWKTGYLNLGFSFYHPVETIDSYSVEGHDNLFLGFPALKLTLNSSVMIGSGFSVSPSLIWASQKYGYAFIDDEENYILEKYNPSWMLNLYFYHDHLFRTPLKAGFGLYNVLNEKNPILQPYDSGHAPLPILSREILLRLEYHWRL